MLAGNINEHETRVLLERTRGQPVRTRLFRWKRRQYQCPPARWLSDDADQFESGQNSTLSACRSWIWSFQHVGGDKPSKEVFMHRAFYQARDDAGAVVHLHSTQATAVSCLPDVDQSNPIPPLTPYFVMRVGRRMPIIPYYRPGDPAMEPAINRSGQGCPCGAAGKSWAGGCGQHAHRCGLCGGGTGRGRQALSDAAWAVASPAERSPG